MREKFQQYLDEAGEVSRQETTLEESASSAQIPDEAVSSWEDEGGAAFNNRSEEEIAALQEEKRALLARGHKEFHIKGREHDRLEEIHRLEDQKQTVDYWLGLKTAALSGDPVAAEELANHPIEKERQFVKKVRVETAQWGNSEEILFYVPGPKGLGKQYLTLGQAMTSEMWGITLDMHSSVPLELQKQFFKQIASVKKRELEDRQVALVELASGTTDARKKETYRDIVDNQQEHQETPGLIAEKMAESLLSVVSFDFPELDIVIEAADPEEDIDLKQDFSIIRPNHVRGAKIEEGDILNFQFTTMSKEVEERMIAQGQRTKSKEAQLGKQAAMGASVVLVRVPMQSVRQAYTTWNAEKKKGTVIGGPEQFLSEGDREGIIRGVLAKIPGLSENEITAALQKMKETISQNQNDSPFALAA